MKNIDFKIGLLPYQGSLKKVDPKDSKEWEKLVVTKTIYIFLGEKINVCRCSKKIVDYHRWSYNVAVEALKMYRPNLIEKELFKPHLVAFVFIYMAFLEQEARILFNRYNTKKEEDPLMLKRINREATKLGINSANKLISSLFETYSVSRWLKIFYEDFAEHIRKKEKENDNDNDN